MPTVAEQLRAAREAKKLTVQQVADATKIRTDHIRALEDGNFNVFSAPIYIRGSVKNYAAMLKMDMPQITAALDAELKGTERFSEPPPLVEASKSPLDYMMFLLSKMNARVALAGGGVLAVVLVVLLAGWAWRHHKRNETAPNLPPAVYQPASSGDTLPLPKK
jgi:cytoskeletal protein RodZ